MGIDVQFLIETSEKHFQVGTFTGTVAFVPREYALAAYRKEAQLWKFR